MSRPHARDRSLLCPLAYVAFNGADRHYKPFEGARIHMPVPKQQSLFYLINEVKRELNLLQMSQGAIPEQPFRLNLM